MGSLPYLNPEKTTYPLDSDGLRQPLDLGEQLESALESVVHAPELAEVLHRALAELALAGAQAQKVPLVDVPV